MDRFPTGPGNGDPGGAEKEPYTEATLDAELAKHIALIKMDLVIALKEGDPEKIEKGRKRFQYVAESPIKAFLDFQNNFYGRLPGGLGRVTLEDLKQIAAEEPGEDLAPMIETLVKQYADVDAVLKEIGADPELMARAKQRENASDPAVSALLRKVYIGMRNRGYTHQELYS